MHVEAQVSQFGSLVSRPIPNSSMLHTEKREGLVREVKRYMQGRSQNFANGGAK